MKPSGDRFTATAAASASSSFASYRALSYLSGNKIKQKCNRSQAEHFGTTVVSVPACRNPSWLMHPAMCTLCTTEVCQMSDMQGFHAHLGQDMPIARERDIVPGALPMQPCRWVVKRTDRNLTGSTCGCKLGLVEGNLGCLVDKREVFWRKGRVWLPLRCDVPERWPCHNVNRYACTRLAALLQCAC